MKLKSNKCIICGKKTSSSYCQYHYLMKEANYAINDLNKKKKWNNVDDKKLLQEMAVERLLNFAKFIIDENDWGRKL